MCILYYFQSRNTVLTLDKGQEDGSSSLVPRLSRTGLLSTAFVRESLGMRLRQQCVEQYVLSENQLKIPKKWLTGSSMCPCCLFVLFVCLFVCLSCCLFVLLLVCFVVCFVVCLSCLFVCLVVCLFCCLFVLLFVCLVCFLFTQQKRDMDIFLVIRDAS